MELAARRGRDDKPKRARRGGAHPIDAHVGQRLRLRRTLLGLSQDDLGRSMGLTFQQIQKYERGKSRIGAGRLYEFGRVLNVPVSFFFDDAPGGTEALAPGASDAPQVPFPMEGRRDRQLLELMRAYRRINDPQVRRSLFELAKSLAALPGATDEPEE